MFGFFLLFIFVLSLIFLNFFKKVSYNNNIQDFHNGSYTKLGGFLLIIFAFFILRNHFTILELLIIYSIALIGLLADFKILNSPKFRFVIQILLLFFLSSFFKEYLVNIFNYLNNYFPFNFLGYLFFIILFIAISSILINGTNFIDGYNGLITIIFIFQLFIYYMIINSDYLLYLIFIFLIFLYFNFFHNIFLGDCGAYFIAALNILFSITIFYLDKGNFINIILINIYPFFETIFSLIRKLKLGRSPFIPDGEHLHMLVFYHLKNNLSLQNNFINSLTGLVIALFYSFYISSIFLFIENSIYKFVSILFFIFFYIIFYWFFLKSNLKKQ